MLLAKDACVIYGFLNLLVLCVRKKSEHGSLTSNPLEKFTGLIQRLINAILTWVIQRAKQNMQHMHRKTIIWILVLVFSSLGVWISCHLKKKAYVLCACRACKGQERATETPGTGVNR